MLAGGKETTGHRDRRCFVRKRFKRPEHIGHFVCPTVPRRIRRLSGHPQEIAVLLPSGEDVVAHAAILARLLKERERRSL